MNTANESQQENNFISRRPSSPRGFENTIPNENYLIHFAQCFLLGRKMQWLFVHCEQGFSWEQRGIVWCFCTLHVAFRTRNTFVVCALCALPFIRAKISLVICAPHAVLLERGILCFMYTLRVAFRTRNTFLGTCAVLLERGILCFLCTSHGAFRTRNTLYVVRFANISLVIFSLRTVLLEREIYCFLCTSHGTFRTRNNLFFVLFTRCF